MEKQVHPFTTARPLLKTHVDLLPPGLNRCLDGGLRRREGVGQVEFSFHESIRLMLLDGELRRELAFSRDPSIGAPDQRVSFEASYIPFAKTPEERKKTGDPRRSKAERYPSREGYLNRYRDAVNEVIQQRYVLPEDRDVLLKRGEEEWDQAMQ